MSGVGAGAGAGGVRATLVVATVGAVGTIGRIECTRASATGYFPRFVHSRHDHQHTGVTRLASTGLTDDESGRRLMAARLVALVRVASAAPYWSAVDPGFVEAERIELEAMRDLFAAAVPALDARVSDIGPAALFTVPAVPAVLFNRAIGLGVFRAACRADVANAAARFAECGVSRYLVHLNPQAEPARLRDWLCEHRLMPLRRAWTKFARSAAPVADAHTDLRIEAIGADRAADFARVACEGYGLPPTAAGLLGPLAGRPRWHVYLTWAGDRIAGTAAMFIDGDLAWLGFGATELAYRGRGSQRALLARRIRDALAAGVRRFHVETGEAVPGEPRSAYHNILGAGFERIYVRDNFCPSSGRASSS
jgi:hypothetical protein